MQLHCWRFKQLAFYCSYFGLSCRSSRRSSRGGCLRLFQQMLQLAENIFSPSHLLSLACPLYSIKAIRPQEENSNSRLLSSLNFYVCSTRCLESLRILYKLLFSVSSHSSKLRFLKSEMRLLSVQLYRHQHKTYSAHCRTVEGVENRKRDFSLLSGQKRRVSLASLLPLTSNALCCNAFAVSRSCLCKVCSCSCRESVS